jgi:hypothetical protein
VKWVKRFFCAHHFEWIRNIYGDEINTVNGKRSLWRCVKCGKLHHDLFLFRSHDPISATKESNHD